MMKSCFLVGELVIRSILGIAIICYFVEVGFILHMSDFSLYKSFLIDLDDINHVNSAFEGLSS